MNIFQANAKYMLKTVWLNKIGFVQTFKCQNIKKKVL